MPINYGEGPGASGRKSDSQTGPAEESRSNVRMCALLFALLKNMAFLFHKGTTTAKECD